MTADELARSLGASTPPVRPGAVGRRIALSLAIGGAATLTVVLAMLGARADLMPAMHGFAFWMKGLYTLSLALVAVVAAGQLARPEAGRPGWLWLLAVPVVALAALAGGELLRTPVGNWPDLWMGLSWRKCSMLVALLSLPPFAGLVIAFRRFAPTRLRLTGAVAGLAAGGFGAALYCVHCPEVSAVFVLTWYSLGIAATAALGWAAGPRLLRW